MGCWGDLGYHLPCGSLGTPQTWWAGWGGVCESLLLAGLEGAKLPPAKTLWGSGYLNPTKGPESSYCSHLWEEEQVLGVACLQDPSSSIAGCMGGIP